MVLRNPKLNLARVTRDDYSQKLEKAEAKHRKKFLMLIQTLGTMDYSIARILKYQKNRLKLKQEKKALNMILKTANPHNLRNWDQNSACTHANLLIPQNSIFRRLQKGKKKKRRKKALILLQKKQK